MALASVGTFSQPGEYYIQSGIAIVTAFAVIGFPSISLWAAVGAKIRVWLSSPTRSGGVLPYTWVHSNCRYTALCQIHVPWRLVHFFTLFRKRKCSKSQCDLFWTRGARWAVYLSCRKRYSFWAAANAAALPLERGHFKRSIWQQNKAVLGRRE